VPSRITLGSCYEDAMWDTHGMTRTAAGTAAPAHAGSVVRT